MSRLDLIGDVLPPEPGHDLVPWEEQEIQAARRPVPLINISLPLRNDEDPAYSAVYEKRHSARPISVESDFAVPLAQSITCAIAAMLAASAGALALGWSWKVPLAAAGVGFAIAWLWRLRIVDGLLWSIESITQTDLDGDRKIGKPAASFTLANPAQARNEARQITATADSEAQKAELLAFVHRCYTVGTGERAHGVRASGSDREAYCRMRDTLLSLGIAKWKREGRPRAGWVMAVSHQRALDIIGRHVL